jgi:hypothetical protein
MSASRSFPRGNNSHDRPNIHNAPTAQDPIEDDCTICPPAVAHNQSAMTTRPRLSKLTAILPPPPGRTGPRTNFRESKLTPHVISFGSSDRTRGPHSGSASQAVQRVAALSRADGFQRVGAVGGGSLPSRRQRAADW